MGIKVGIDGAILHLRPSPCPLRRELRWKCNGLSDRSRSSTGRPNDPSVCDIIADGATSGRGRDPPHDDERGETASRVTQPRPSSRCRKHDFSGPPLCWAMWIVDGVDSIVHPRYNASSFDHLLSVSPHATAPPPMGRPRVRDLAKRKNAGDQSDGGLHAVPATVSVSRP